MSGATLQQPGWRPRRFSQSRLWKLGLTAAVLMLAWYLAGPFVTLWRITHAVQAGDAATLQSLIDWTTLRQGLKDDVASGMLGLPPQPVLASNTLPPFGAGFVHGIAGSEIDRMVTPIGLIQAAHGFSPPARGPAISAAGIRGLSFPSLTALDVRLAADPQPGAPALHLRLGFRGGHWRLTRAWIPQDLVDLASSGG